MQLLALLRIALCAVVPSIGTDRIFFRLASKGRWFESIPACPTSPPPGLLGVGLGGDNSARMIAFQA